VAAAWEASRHGVALVKCLVCHGSTGKDFVRRPSPERCRGCHGAAVDSAAALARKGLDCFACHEPHSLSASPHARAGK
jgi:predicted CXXCH cytochrome family protein